MEQQERRNWSSLSRYRGAISGLATILVILHHFLADALNYDLPRQAIRWLYYTYYFIKPTGVPIFFFISGMGLYYSLQKKPALGTFYRKRAASLLIPYALWGVVFWSVCDLFIKAVGEKQLLLDYFLITFYTRGNHSFWFVAIIVAFYLISPLLFLLLRHENRFRLAALWGLIVGFSWLWFTLRRGNYAVYKNLEIGIWRILIFIVGIWYGEKTYYKKPYSWCDVLLVVLPILLRLYTSLNYLHTGSKYVFLRPVGDFYSVAILLLLVMAAEWIHAPRLNAALTAIGKYSLELYLTHVSIWNLIGYYGIHSPLSFAAVILMSVVLSVGLKSTAASLTGWIDRHLQRK